eukprot:TRINITY_DN20919_c0_g1_i1.p1 TRINITY_DN20919_c0_g1~~TRINITY_DN20919_c0_g1_i1.p1  ORF type:complete len:1167 (+),score=256.14 TRINITY_DN20919_c0_g1_i1:96-3596(+)
MLKRDDIPLNDEVPVWAELSALRVGASRRPPWNDGLPMPRISRLEACEPPWRPPREERKAGWNAAVSELRNRQYLGGADVRLWVTNVGPKHHEDKDEEHSDGDGEKDDDKGNADEGEADEEADVKKRFSTPTGKKHTRLNKLGQRAGTEGQGQLDSSTSGFEVKAFLAHQHLLAAASPLLRHKLKLAAKAAADGRAQNDRTAGAQAVKNINDRAARAEQGDIDFEEGNWKKEILPKRDVIFSCHNAPPTAPLLEVELIVHDPSEVFGEILAWIYGTPKTLDISLKTLKGLTTKRWWPLLSMAQYLELQELEKKLRELLLELPGQVSQELTWGLLHLTAAQKLEPEMQKCCDVLARNGGHLAARPEVKLGELPLQALNSLLSTKAWVVSEEYEVFEVFWYWMKEQRWMERHIENCLTRYEDDEVMRNAPPEVFEAAAGWDIRWGVLPANCIRILAQKGVVPNTLREDCERWRIAARVPTPKLRKQKEVDVDKTDAVMIKADSHKGSDVRLRRGQEKNLKNPTKFQINNAKVKNAGESNGIPIRMSIFNLGDNPFGDLSGDTAKQIQTILAVKPHPGNKVPLSPPTSVWRQCATETVQLKQSKGAELFFSGMRTLCRDVDERFGWQHLGEQKRSSRMAAANEDEEDQEPEQAALRYARQVASKHLAFIETTCEWMMQRRCHHRYVTLPNDWPKHFTGVFVEQDRLVLRLRTKVGRTVPKTPTRSEESPKSVSARPNSGRSVHSYVSSRDSRDSHDIYISGGSQASRASEEDAPEVDLPDPIAEQSDKDEREEQFAEGALAADGEESSPQEQNLEPRVRTEAAQDLTRAVTSPAKLLTTQMVWGGRHEILLRLLIRRPQAQSSEDPLAKRRLPSSAVAKAVAAAFHIGIDVFNNDAEEEKADVTGEASSQTPVDASRPSQSPKRIGPVHTAALRVAENAVAVAISNSLGAGSMWPVEGLLDAVIMVVFDASVKRVMFAVDAAFTYPYLTSAPGGAESQQGDSVEFWIPAEGVADALVSRGGTPESSRRSSVASEGHISLDGFINVNDRFKMGPATVVGKTNPILQADRFLQKRHFLKSWRFEEHLERDLRKGLQITRNVQIKAGHDPSYKMSIEPQSALLGRVGGEGGEATLEILPRDALRPSWWVDIMGNTIDMPRPAFQPQMEWGQH